MKRVVTKEIFQGILLGGEIKKKTSKEEIQCWHKLKETPNFYDKTDNYTFFLTQLMVYIQVLKFSNYIEE